MEIKRVFLLGFATAAVLAAAAPAGAADLAIDGKKIFVSTCSSCHALNDEGTNAAVGPNLNTVLKGQSAAMITASILYPNKIISKGYTANIMPANYGTSLTKAELGALIQYINFGSTPEQQRAAGVAMGKEAYLYGFPISEFNLIRKADLKLNAPMNVLTNAQKLAVAGAEGVVAPNNDTLYTLAQLDLTKGPVVLKVPKMGSRYWTFEFLEPYTNVVGYIGKRLNGSGGGTWAIEWSGAKSKKPLPKGVKRFKSSARSLWVIGRTLVQGGADTAKARALMAQYRLGTLADLMAGKALPKPRKLSPGRPKVVEPKGLAFLDALSASMTADPPPARDAAIVARMQQFGIGVGLKPSTAEMPEPVREGLAEGVDAAAAALPIESKLPVLEQAKANGGWFNPPAKAGIFGTDYQLRARVALLGIGINTVEESTYPTALTDVAGAPFNGANNYRMVFKPGKLPPVAGFWSVTMYDTDGYLVANPANIYAIGPSHPGMITQKDGSVVIAIQQTKPTEKDVNWLPSPPAGFRLNMRLYLPSKAILNSTWKEPAVEKVG